MAEGGESIFTRLAPVLNVCDLAAERGFFEFALERNDPAPGWSYRRIILQSPSGYRVALEGPRET